MRKRPSRPFGSLVAGAALLGALGCSQDQPADNPFSPVAECQGPTVAYGKGDHTMVIAGLEIASTTLGFDLDRDGKPDNKLGVLRSLAADALDETFQRRHDVIIPMEFYGATAGDSDCTKFAFYLGQFNQDRDQDQSDTNWSVESNGAAKGDCDDQDPAVRSGHDEVMGNRLDDDCDGYADNADRRKPTTDNTDQDGDGVTLAEGDCDDRPTSRMVMTEAGMVPLAKLRHPQVMAKSIAAAAERCDGVDYNCDGIPDNAPACDPFGDANVALDIQKISLDPMGQPLLTFRSGTVRAGALNAGPDIFRVALPLMQDLPLDLELSGARVRGTFRQVGDKTYLDDALLGGVLEAVSLARLDKINAKGFITPPQSLFDAVWAGAALAAVLNLKSDADGHLLPDMDVDRDGLETFWASDPNKTPALVDTCKDGDGTIIRNGDAQYDNPDPMKRCVFAKDGKGGFRFVDGISAALKFKGVPARLGKIVEAPMK